jgi:4-hydroxy-tetrahydrodipicolinate synthase
MPEAAALIRKEDEELVKTGIPQEGIRRFFTKKNEERFTFQNNNFIKLSDGRKWIVYTAWDITDLKIMERKLRLAKEEAEESNRIQEILDWRSRDFLVLSGDDALTLDLMSRGADGVISVAVNAFPRKMMTCIDLAKKGDFEGAHKAYECLEEAVTALFAEGNPTGVKCAMSVLGLIGNTLRLPLVPGTPQLEARFKELIAKYDLN